MSKLYRTYGTFHKTCAGSVIVHARYGHIDRSLVLAGRVQTSNVASLLSSFGTRGEGAVRITASGVVLATLSHALDLCRSQLG